MKGRWLHKHLLVCLLFQTVDKGGYQNLVHSWQTLPAKTFVLGYGSCLSGFRLIHGNLKNFVKLPIFVETGKYKLLCSLRKWKEIERKWNIFLFLSDVERFDVYMFALRVKLSLIFSVCVFMSNTELHCNYRSFFCCDTRIHRFPYFLAVILFGRGTTFNYFCVLFVEGNRVC